MTKRFHGSGICDCCDPPLAADVRAALDLLWGIDYEEASRVDRAVKLLENVPARITDLERALENGDRLLSQAGRQCHERYGLAEVRITDLEAQVAALTQEREEAREEMSGYGHVKAGLIAEADACREQMDAAYAALATTRQALTEIAAGLGYPTLYREVARRALAATDSDTAGRCPGNLPASSCCGAPDGECIHP